MSGHLPSAQDVMSKAASATFGRPLITNVHRGLVAEAIVASALEPEWRWCSQDYSSWDFERADGAKLEVKQSAARQSWAAAGASPSTCSFDIASRTGRWENGVDWVAEPGRSANLYVFAHHPVAHRTADHRNPAQWRFYVIATQRLPNTRRLSLPRLTDLGQACTFAQLRQSVAIVANQACR
jgi:hypothetical protein